MAKLKLQPNPTFKASVGIPVAGGDPVSVEFTFRHRSRDDLQAFIDGSPKRSDVENIMDMATAWELSDAFTAESVQLLVQNYISAPLAIFQSYLDELVKARTGN